MYLDDIPINYWGVLVAAVVYYILGAIWYSPYLFGDCSNKKEGCCPTSEPKNKEECCAVGESKKSECGCKIAAYIGQFIISLVIAYVLALFIEISQAEQVVEGITVAFWAWLGFIATTHFSPVLWGRKSFKNYLVHAGFLLLGFIVMGAVIILVGV